MPSYGQSTTITYTAWNTTTSQPAVGDAANHTLRWIKDGNPAAPAGAITEVDPANAPGDYKVTLTGAECQCIFGKLGGKSSTPGVVIIGTPLAFENLPTAALGAANGLPVLDGSAHLLAYSVSQPVTVGANSDKTGYRLDLTQPIPASNTAQTVGDALNAARAQGFGKWEISGNNLLLYAGDGTTVVRTFALDDALAPTQRT